MSGFWEKIGNLTSKTVSKLSSNNTQKTEEKSKNQGDIQKTKEDETKAQKAYSTASSAQGIAMINMQQKDIHSEQKDKMQAKLDQMKKEQDEIEALEKAVTEQINASNAKIEQDMKNREAISSSVDISSYNFLD